MFLQKLLLIVLAGLFYQELLAEENYEYPELLVTPSASKTLKREDVREDKEAWLIHWPVQLSAAMTMYSGFNAMNDNNKDGSANTKAEQAGQAAVLVGGGWLLTTLTVSAIYRPYSIGSNEVKKMATGSKREMIELERLAEVSLMKAARIGWRLKFLSIVSNLAVNAFVISQVQEEDHKLWSGIALATSLFPLLVPYHWEDVYHQHEEFKKRIYGPLSNVGILYEKITHDRVVPMIQFSFPVTFSI